MIFSSCGPFAWAITEGFLGLNNFPYHDILSDLRLKQAQKILNYLLPLKANGKLLPVDWTASTEQGKIVGLATQPN